jgi:hypothetical protein
MTPQALTFNERNPEAVWCKLQGNFSDWKQDLYGEEYARIHQKEFVEECARIHKKKFPQFQVLSDLISTRTVKHIRSYLLLRENFEESPYYKGRYLVAASTVRNAERGLSLPYEVAEILFQDSRYARKVERWLENRRAQFEHWTVRFDGSIGEQIASLPAKKQPQSVKALVREKGSPGKTEQAVRL